MAETDAEQESRIKTMDEYHERAPRRWPLLLGYILVALIVAALIVFGARAIYHHYHKPLAKTTVTSSKITSATTQSGSSNSSSSSQSGTSNNNAAASSTGSSLPNSGPGPVAAIFISGSAVAAGTHFVLSRRRQKQS